MEEFRLDTSNMNTVIGNIQNLAADTEEIRSTIQELIQSATEGWSGRSRTAFEKKSHMLLQQVTDVSQSLFDIAEELINAAMSYREADTALAKVEDGVATAGSGGGGVWGDSGGGGSGGGGGGAWGDSGGGVAGGGSDGGGGGAW